MQEKKTLAEEVDRLEKAILGVVALVEQLQGNVSLMEHTLSELQARVGTLEHTIEWGGEV